MPAWATAKRAPAVTAIGPACLLSGHSDMCFLLAEIRAVGANRGRVVGRQPESARTSTSLAAPHPRAVRNALATSCSAAESGGDVAFPEPGGSDHRRRRRGGQQRDLRVERLHPRIPLRHTLFRVAVDLPDGVVHVQLGQLVGAGQQPAPARTGWTAGGCSPRQAAGRERPQERAQRRRRPHVLGDPAHPAMPDLVEVVDAVRSRRASRR